MSQSLGEAVGEIKRWYQGSAFKKWLYAYTMVGMSHLGTDDDGDVVAYCEYVFEDFTDRDMLSKAFTLAKKREEDNFAKYYDIYKIVREH